MDARNLSKIYAHTRRRGIVELKTTNASSFQGAVRSHFGDLREPLLELIEKSEIVVGLVAWMTDRLLLEALSRKKRVSIVVQKEDFLRPDLEPNKEYLRIAYQKLKGFRSEEGDMLPSITTLYGQYPPEWEGQGVRCFGYRREKGVAAQPTMHHKFLVFCSILEEVHGGIAYETLYPYAVWTGSYNLTFNATASRENAIYIEDFSIAKSYFQEWSNILALSEPLNWEREWHAPDYAPFMGT